MLCDSDVVLPSVLAQEQPLFAFKQARQVQSVTGTLISSFIDYFLSVVGFLSLMRLWRITKEFRGELKFPFLPANC